MSLTATLLIVIGIGGLIFFHELGHFTVAKLSGVKVEVFSVGFGWKLLKKKVGETEYCLSAIPLGGYVKMAGELPNEERSGADYELHSKSAWKRFWIFSAGSLMNLLLAFPICILMYWIGVSVPDNHIGWVKPDSAEWEAGIEAGEVLKAYQIKSGSGEQDGWGPKHEVTSLGDYQEALLTADPGTPIRLILSSKNGNNNGSTREVIVEAHSPMKQGIAPYSNVVDYVQEDSPASRAGLESDDRIVRIQDWSIRSVHDIQKSIKKFLNPELHYFVRRSDGSTDVKTISVSPGTPYLIRMQERMIPLYHPTDSLDLVKKFGLKEGEYIYRINHHHLGEAGKEGRQINTDSLTREGRFVEVPSGDMKVQVLRGEEKHLFQIKPQEKKRNHIHNGILFKPVVERVKQGSPAAKGGLQSGDRILKLNEFSVDSLYDMNRLLDSFVGEDIDVTVQRKEEKKKLTITPGKNHFGEGELGIIVKTDQKSLALPELPENSGFLESGFQKGDVLKAFYTSDGTRKKLAKPVKLIEYINRESPEKIKFVVERNSGDNTKEIENTLRLLQVKRGTIGVRLAPVTFQKKFGFVKGISRGMSRAAGMFGLTIKGITRLFKGSESAGDNLAGPVRIFSMSYETARRDTGQFLLMLAMITISLGILNLLPLPPLDGGHILFLIIEKVRGGPLSENTLYLVQMMGFLFLILLILVVTYNDIVNLMG